MARLFLFIKYFLVILVIAIIGVVASLAFVDFKYFQPILKNYDLAVALPESLPRLLDAESGNALKYSVARAMLADSRSKARGHLTNAIWGSFVGLHLTKSEQHAVFASRAYLGKNVYGFQQASKHFYSKGLLDITPQEAALLVARLRSPSHAIKHPEQNKNSAEDLLLKAGYGT